MNILFITHRFPFPPNRGGKIRPFQMIRHLSRNHSVTVASLAHSEQELREGAELSQHCDKVIAEVLPSARRWRKAVLTLPTATPSSAAYFWSERLRSRILEQAARVRPDVVWVHCAFMAAYAEGIECGLRVMDYGDLDSGKWFEYSSYRPFPLSFGYGLEGRKLRLYEKRITRSFDCCTFTAPGELQEFRDWGLPCRSELIPNGVDFDYFHRRSTPPSTSFNIVFLGRMDYFPNVQGIIHFAKGVFPKIRERVPEAKLQIVGSNPIASVRDLARDSAITVTGSVPDVRPYLADAALAIAPLKIARGTQNKILECMAVGLPVVSSWEASRGVQATPGEHLLVAASDSEFQDHVVRLLQDPLLRDRIAAAARLQVERAHCWPRSMDILDGIISGQSAADIRTTTETHLLV